MKMLSNTARLTKSLLKAFLITFLVRTNILMLFPRSPNKPIVGWKENIWIFRYIRFWSTSPLNPLKFYIWKFSEGECFIIFYFIAKLCSSWLVLRISLEQKLGSSWNSLVNYYLVSLTFKFHKNRCTNARAQVVNVRTRDKTCACAFTAREGIFMHESLWNFET